LIALLVSTVFTQSSKGEYQSKLANYWKIFNVKVLRDLSYSEAGNDGERRLDLYLPSSSRPVPIIICIHGCCLGCGDKSSFPVYLLQTKGYAVASINYRRSSQAPFPAQVNDCKDAINWLVKNKAAYGLDGSRIGLWGSSTGGHLAALIGLGYGEAKES